MALGRFLFQKVSGRGERALGNDQKSGLGLIELTACTLTGAHGPGLKPQRQREGAETSAQDSTTIKVIHRSKYALKMTGKVQNTRSSFKDMLGL